MHIKKMMFCASVFVVVSAISLTGQAAEQQNNKSTNQNKTQEHPKVEKKVPIVIEADNLSFSDVTGDIFADGNVVVVKDGDKILTDFMRGNSKRTEFWIDGQADLIQPGTKLTGTGTHYNYTQRIGFMNNAVGVVQKEHIFGKNIDILPDEIILHDGTITKCPAKVPDYHVSAEKIEIWPGDKLIARNAKFWLGGMVIYALPKYQTSLREGELGAQDAFPRIGYSNKNGLSIKQKFEHPIDDHVAAYVDLGYYSKLGFKNQYGLIDRERNYSLDLMQGDYRDSDANWIKKEPELKFNYYRKRVGDLPVTYTFSASYGKWVDANKTSWHQDYDLYFTRDTIHLSKSLFLNMGVGFESIRESYDGSISNSLNFDSALTKQWAPKFSTTAEYHYTKNTNSLFSYEANDMSREGDIGFTYKIDQKNSISFRERYDLDHNKIYDRDYTWYRDLHCWQAKITYRAERHQLNWNITTTHW